MIIQKSVTDALMLERRTDVMVEIPKPISKFLYILRENDFIGYFMYCMHGYTLLRTQDCVDYNMAQRNKCMLQRHT